MEQHSSREQLYRLDRSEIMSDYDVNDTTFLGKGMKFPPQINKATGRFMTSSEKENIKESIYLILMTQKTERFMRPDFGSSIMQYTFIDTNSSVLTMMSRNIREDIATNEPRVENVTVNIDPEVKKGCLIVNIDYTIAAENAKDNLVFPFYLNAAAE